MGQTVPSQHPAVVLRSHFNQLRALLAVALIAVIGLTVAEVILAGHQDQAANTSSAAPIGKLNYGGYNPATGRPESAPPLQRELRMYGFTPEQAARETLPGTRYDGGPDEGTRGPLKHHSKNPATGNHDSSPRPSPSTRYDGGPDEGTRGPRYHTP